MSKSLNWQKFEENVISIINGGYSHEKYFYTTQWSYLHFISPQIKWFLRRLDRLFFPREEWDYGFSFFGKPAPNT